MHEAVKFTAMIVFLNPNKLDRIEVYLDSKYSNFYNFNTFKWSLSLPTSMWIMIEVAWVSLVTQELLPMQES